MSKANKYIPGDGRAWNPMLKLDRNSQCLCHSGRKFKKCCLPGLPRTADAKQAAEASAAMRVLAEHRKAKR